jgi:hypothetical protein
MCNYKAEFSVCEHTTYAKTKKVYFDTGNRTNLLASEEYCYRALTYSAISEYEGLSALFLVSNLCSRAPRHTPRKINGGQFLF